MARWWWHGSRWNLPKGCWNPVVGKFPLKKLKKFLWATWLLTRKFEEFSNIWGGSRSDTNRKSWGDMWHSLMVKANQRLTSGAIQMVWNGKCDFKRVKKKICTFIHLDLKNLMLKRKIYSSEYSIFFKIFNILVF